MAIKAIIFDMDDLMINSHPMHMAVFEAVLNKYGASLKNPKKPLTKEEEVGFFGKKIKEVIVHLRKKYKLEDKVSVSEMNNNFNELMLLLTEQHVQPMPGLYKLINWLKKKGYKLVLASSAKKTKIVIVLKKLSLLFNIFEGFVSGEDEIKHGKPAPDIFLKAAEKARVKPKQCLVLEDAKNGVEAAKAAGMYCIGVHNKFTYQRLGIKQDLSKADLQVHGLNEISINDIKNI